MPKKYKIMPDTPASEVNAMLRTSTNLCMDDAISRHQSMEDKTALDMVNHTLDKDAPWTLLKLGRDAPPELRDILITKVKDPMVAFSLYLRLEWLTDEEDKLLEEKFKGKLPTAEAELKKGIVTRAKHGSNSL